MEAPCITEPLLLSNSASSPPSLPGTLPGKLWSWSTQTPPFWVILALLVTCAVSLRLTYLALFHPLSRYPGPKLWAISRIPWAYHVIKGDVWHSLDRFHDQYGPVVRIAPDELTFITPEAWKDIYAAKPDLNKDPYSLTPPINRADSLFTAVGDNHKRIRGAFISAFSDKALREQAGILEGYAGQFVQRLRAELRGSPSGTVDMHSIVGCAAFDIISDLTWGESPGALQATGPQDWVTRFFLHAKFSTVRNCLSRFPPLDRILYHVFLRITSAQRVANTRLTTERINRRLAAGHARSDFMTPIIGKISEGGGGGGGSSSSSSSNSSNKGITKSEVLTNGLAVIIANSQLTTIAITSAIYLLLRHPEHLRRAAAEMSDAGLFRDESDIGVATTTSQALPYLQAVINETLRLHHPTPGNLPRVAPAGGIAVAGRVVPGGSVVGVSLYNMHTRRENFADPLGFHPERFLDDPADPRYDPAFRGDRLDAFQPFSLGQRNCIGSRMFLAEARVMLARLIWAFDMELAEPDAAAWLDQKAWLVYEPRPLRVRLKEKRCVA